MGTTGYNYDTAAIRREARKLNRCYEKLNSAAGPRVKAAQGELRGNFQGRAADALNESLSDINTQLTVLGGEIYRLYKALMRYADALEEADERAARLMRK